MLNHVNMKPEKEVEKEILSYAPLYGFDLTVVDSANVFSHSTKKFTRRMTSEVCSDLIGNNGPYACFIELKAKGKLSQFNTPKNIKQKLFIMRKIQSGSFACVVDSMHRLMHIWKLWNDAQTQEEKIKTLFSLLP